MSTNVCPPISDAQRNASTESSMESRTCCPEPVRSRASSAEVMAWAAVIAVSLSGRIVRTSLGRSWSEPAWTVVSPEMAWMIGS